MLADTRPAELDAATGPDPWREFRVDHPQDRLTLLRRLRDGDVPVVLSAPNGITLTTTLWSLDDKGLRFGVDPAWPPLARLLDADEAVAVAYLDSVKLQFDLHDLVLVHGQESSALRASMPQQVYRFQRRQYYRVRTQEHHAPTARLPHPTLPGAKLALRVLDVSMGGCALWQAVDGPRWPLGATLGEVHVTLDADTHFVATLILQHRAALPAAQGGGARMGCQWRLGGTAERSLQRWVDQAQKRRRLTARA